MYCLLVIAIIQKCKCINNNNFTDFEYTNLIQRIKRGDTVEIQIVTSIISAVSVLSGSLIGAFCSWLINKKMYSKQFTDEEKFQKENLFYKERCRAEKLCNNANILRLDIATAIYQSIRILRNEDISKRYLYLLPICRYYSNAVASLSNSYTLQETSNVYQLYGIIEKVNRDIYIWNTGDDISLDKIKAGFVSILMHIYDVNYKEILKVDPNEISYEDLYKNDFIKTEFKEFLVKLDELCLLENMLKDRNS